MRLPASTFQLRIDKALLQKLYLFLNRHAEVILLVSLIIISIFNFVLYYRNGLGLAYNDARSHLEISAAVWSKG